MYVYLLLFSFIILQDYSTLPESMFILRVHEPPLCQKLKIWELGQHTAIMVSCLADTPSGAVH